LSELLNGAASKVPPDTGVGTSEGEPEAEGEAPQPLTREETQALIDAGSKETLSAAKIVSQSLVDKAEHRIGGRLSSDLSNLARYFDDMKAAGHEVPAEVIAKVEQDVMLRSLKGESAEGEGPSDGAGRRAPKGDLGELDSDQATGMVAIAMMEEADCYIEDGDVELKLIDTRTKSTTKFLKSVETSIKAKQDRLAGSSEEEPEGEEDDDAGRKARTPAGLKGKRAPKSVPDGLSAMEYLKRGYAKSKK